jgi:hypothetical protein
LGLSVLALRTAPARRTLGVAFAAGASRTATGASRTATGAATAIVVSGAGGTTGAAGTAGRLRGPLGCREQCLAGEADAALAALVRLADGKDLDLDGLADGDPLGGIVDPLVREFGAVEEADVTAELDEDAELGDRDDLALHHVTGVGQRGRGRRGLGGGVGGAGLSRCAGLAGLLMRATGFPLRAAGRTLAVGAHGRQAVERGVDVATDAPSVPAQGTTEQFVGVLQIAVARLLLRRGELRLALGRGEALGAVHQKLCEVVKQERAVGGAVDARTVGLLGGTDVALGVLCPGATGVPDELGVAALGRVGPGGFGSRGIGIPEELRAQDVEEGIVGEPALEFAPPFGEEGHEAEIGARIFEVEEQRREALPDQLQQAGPLIRAERFPAADFGDGITDDPDDVAGAAVATGRLNGDLEVLHPPRATRDTTLHDALGEVFPAGLEAQGGQARADLGVLHGEGEEALELELDLGRGAPTPGLAGFGLGRRFGLGRLGRLGALVGGGFGRVGDGRLGAVFVFHGARIESRPARGGNWIRRPRGKKAHDPAELWHSPVSSARFSSDVAEEGRAHPTMRVAVRLDV